MEPLANPSHSTTNNSTGMQKSQYSEAEMAEGKGKYKSIRRKLSIRDAVGKDSNTFALFPSFPLEIRRQIWKHALIGPHIHIISSRVATRSSITEIMQSCKEAYDEGLQLHFSHFTFCDYTSYDDNDHHTRLPKHYMNPDADIMWIVDKNPETSSLLPLELSLYDGHPSYRMVRTLVINHQLWTDPQPVFNIEGPWKMGSLQYIPFSMCKEIWVVLNDVAFSLDHGVTFVAPLDYPNDLISLSKFTSQGYEKFSWDFYEAAKKREKSYKYLKKNWQRIYEDWKSKLGWGDSSYDFSDTYPRIRYVAAKPGGIRPSSTCIKSQRSTIVGSYALPSLNLDLFPDWLRYLVGNKDDDSGLAVEYDTDNYSDGEDFVAFECDDELECGLKYDSQAEDSEDIEDEDEDNDETEKGDGDGDGNRDGNEDGDGDGDEDKNEYGDKGLTLFN